MIILGFEGVAAGHTGNAIEDITNICTVHPLREDTVKELLRKDNAGTDLLEALIKGEYLKKVGYKSKTFYVRQFHF